MEPSFMFVQTWAPTFCFVNIFGNRVSPATKFTIHGLWPFRLQLDIDTEKTNFLDLMALYCSHDIFELDWNKISTPTEVVSYDQLESPNDPSIIIFFLDKLAILKLNGSIGSDMGWSSPRSLIEIRDQFTILDMTVLHIKIIGKFHNSNVEIDTFKQSQYPLVAAVDFSPLPSKGHTGKDGCFHQMATTIEDEVLFNLKMALDELPQISDTEKINFLDLMARYCSRDILKLDWNKISTPTEVVSYDQLESLNGGIGTDMGWSSSRSLIEVRDKFTILDMIVLRLKDLNSKYRSKVLLLLMNSFHTNDETHKITQKYQNSGIEIHTFNRSRYPLVVANEFSPLPSKSHTNKDGWYIPGHEDVFL